MNQEGVKHVGNMLYTVLHSSQVLYNMLCNDKSLLCNMNQEGVKFGGYVTCYMHNDT